MIQNKYNELYEILTLNHGETKLNCFPWPSTHPCFRRGGSFCL